MSHTSTRSHQSRSDHSNPGGYAHTSDIFIEICSLIPALRGFSRTFYKNQTDADDLVQETVARAIANISKFRPGTNLKSWMFTIMRNTFCTEVKRRAREHPGAEECVAVSPSVQQDQDWVVQGHEVRDCIETLSPEQRDVLILIGIQGASYEEAAAQTGCAIGTIKSRLNRARHRVLIQLEAESAYDLFADRGIEAGDRAFRADGP